MYTRDNKNCLKFQKCLQRDLISLLLLCHLIYTTDISHLCMSPCSTVKESKNLRAN